MVKCNILFLLCISTLALFSFEINGTRLTRETKYAYNGLLSHPMFSDIPNRVQRGTCRKTYRICENDESCCSQFCDKSNKKWVSYGICRYPKIMPRV